MSSASEQRYTILVADDSEMNRSILRSMLEECAAKRGMTLYVPPISLCGDNAAMIGSQAYYEYLAGVRAGTALNAAATMKLDLPYADRTV